MSQSILIIEFLIVLLCAVAFYKISASLNFLDAKALFAATISGVLIYSTGKWPWLLPMLYFFISSSFFSLAGKNLKQQFKSTFEKSSTRDYQQVLANSFVALIFCISELISSNNLNYTLYISSIAAVTADTWATEIGVFSRGNPYNILNFRQVDKGQSGAISPLGICASFAGSFSIAFFFGYLLSPFSVKTESILIIGLAGFFASLIDSYFGSFIQAQYFDEDLKKFTERRLNESGKINKLISGHSFIGNDMVNVLSSASSPIFYLILSCYVA